MPAQRKYPQELRERAIRLVVEARAQEPSLSLTVLEKKDQTQKSVNTRLPRKGIRVANTVEAKT